MPTILLVDDDAELLRALTLGLEQEQFEVLAEASGERALDVLGAKSVDLLVLDVLLPGMDGFATCRAIRGRGLFIPIILLTVLGGEADRLTGLESGADDYLAKPFSVRELVARIHARLRRRSSGRTSRARYQGQGLDIDLVNRMATRGGHARPLSSKEVAILRLLIEHRGEAVPRDVIARELVGHGTDLPNGTVDYHIRRLREKLEADPHDPQVIASVYGQGYKFIG